MKVNENNYTIKVGLRALRVLKDEYGIDLTEQELTYDGMAKLVHTCLKCYHLPDITLEEVEDALDEDPTGLTETTTAMTAFFERITESLGAAKNSNAAS